MEGRAGAPRNTGKRKRRLNRSSERIRASVDPFLDRSIDGITLPIWIEQFVTSRPRSHSACQPAPLSVCLSVCLSIHLSILAKVCSGFCVGAKKQNQRCRGWFGMDPAREGGAPSFLPSLDVSKKFFTGLLHGRFLENYIQICQKSQRIGCVLPIL